MNYWYLKILLQALFKIGDKSKAVFHSNCQDCFSHFTYSFTEAINEKVNIAASWHPVQPLTVEAASPAQCQCLFVFLSWSVQRRPDRFAEIKAANRKSMKQYLLTSFSPLEDPRGSKMSLRNSVLFEGLFSYLPFKSFHFTF